MENKIITVENPYDGSLIEHILIDRGNGEFTSMPKAVYDAQVAQATLVTESAPTA